MRIWNLGLAAGLLVLTAGLAHADGVDPVINMGGGFGSPPCVQNGVSYQATADSGGNITTTTGMCENIGPGDVTSFSFDVPVADAPGGITPTLDNLLAPFPNIPSLGALNPGLLDWTAACTTSSDGADFICTASQSTEVAGAESTFCMANFGNATFCSEAQSLTASQLDADFPQLFGNITGGACGDPLVYIILGVIPGCDLTTLTVPGGGVFAADSVFDLDPAGTPAAPLPEPASLAMLAMGLSSLPLLRRRFVR